jgi:hypothetical protein
MHLHDSEFFFAGMLCPHIVNWSMLLGAIISWGILWPELKRKEGTWYPEGLDARSFKGIFAYKVKYVSRLKVTNLETTIMCLH